MTKSLGKLSILTKGAYQLLTIVLDPNRSFALHFSCAFRYPIN